MWDQLPPEIQHMYDFNGKYDPIKINQIKMQKIIHYLKTFHYFLTVDSNLNSIYLELFQIIVSFRVSVAEWFIKEVYEASDVPKVFTIENLEKNFSMTI